MHLYRQFSTQSEIDEQYNAGTRVSDYADWLKWYQTRSGETREQLLHRSVSFGPTRDEYIDIYPAATAGAPVAVFIHGGYWRAGTAGDYAFVANGLQRRGFCVAVCNYSLCPKVTIDEITRQSRATVAWLYHHAAQHNGDPDRIVVCGHSAGGQQVGMLLSTAWRDDYDLPDTVLQAAMPISGVFDIEPLRSA